MLKASSGEASKLGKVIGPGDDDQVCKFTVSSGEASKLGKIIGARDHGWV